MMKVILLFPNLNQLWQNWNDVIQNMFFNFLNSICFSMNSSKKYFLVGSVLLIGETSKDKSKQNLPNQISFFFPNVLEIEFPNEVRFFFFFFFFDCLIFFWMFQKKKQKKRRAFRIIILPFCKKFATILSNKKLWILDRLWMKKRIRMKRMILSWRKKKQKSIIYLLKKKNMLNVYANYEFNAEKWFIRFSPKRDTKFSSNHW